MIRQIEFRAMGCRIFAALDSLSGRNARRLEQLPMWFEAWEQVLSRFREDSELSLLNRSAGTPVKVSGTLWDVVQAARQAERSSGGLVTPTILNALVMAGYDQSFEGIPREQILSPGAYPASTAVQSGVTCDIEARTICLSPDLQLDFGGVAKGWAAHQAAQRLKAYGPVLVNAGGDIAISSLQEDGLPWPVAIEDPFDPESDLETLELGRCGAATSGKDYRRWKRDGVLSHHIIDPRTGQSAETDVLAATVIAPTVLEAEMAAKVVLIYGSQPGLAWLEARPQMAGLLVLDDGQQLYSQRLDKYLRR
jgi:thiamine biosynthesis lipoprotein